jgi:hypothetical protein
MLPQFATHEAHALGQLLDSVDAIQAHFQFFKHTVAAKQQWEGKPGAAE